MLRLLGADLAACVERLLLWTSRFCVRAAPWWSRLARRLTVSVFVGSGHAKTGSNFVSLEHTDVLGDMLSPGIAALLREHAVHERTEPEVIIREAVSAYLGITA